MRFVVERDVLAEAVAWVARSLPTRPVLPVLSGLLLQAAPDGLSLACFDYEVSAGIRVPADVAEPGVALVPGRLLAEITRSLPALPVEVGEAGDVGDAGDLVLTCGPASFSLVTLPLREYPQLPELPRLAGTVDGGALATAIGQVTPAASRDDTLPVITGVNVEIEGDLITLVATDRYRLAIRELSWSPAEPEQEPRRPGARSTLLVPARTLADAARMMTPGIPVRIMLSAGSPAEAGRTGRAADPAGSARAADAMIGFETGERRLATRLIAGEYIKYSSKFPGEFGSTGDMPATALAEAVRRVALVAERGSSVRLSFGPGQVTIEAGTKGQARARETVPAEFTGEESAIAFSPGYLLDGIGAALTAACAPGPAEPAGDPEDPGHRAKAGKAGKPGRDGAAPGPDGRIRLQFTGPTKPALITGSPKAGDESAPDYRYLVVPLRALADA